MKARALFISLILTLTLLTVSCSKYDDVRDFTNGIGGQVNGDTASTQSISAPIDTVSVSTPLWLVSSHALSCGLRDGIGHKILTKAYNYKQNWPAESHALLSVNFGSSNFLNSYESYLSTACGATLAAKVLHLVRRLSISLPTAP